MYYRYWMHKGDHNVYAHYGVRTAEYKLIYYYADALGQAGTIDERHKPEWELFDLKKDPAEMRSVYRDPAYAGTARELTRELHRLQASFGAARAAAVGTMHGCLDPADGVDDAARNEFMRYFDLYTQRGGG